MSRGSSCTRTSAAQISTSAAQISTSSDDGGEPRDSGDEVSIAGWEGVEVNQAPAVIGPDSTAEDTAAAIVEVDATVGILDVDSTGVEAVEPKAKNKVATLKTFSHLNKMDAQDKFPASTRYFKTY